MWKGLLVGAVYDNVGSSIFINRGTESARCTQRDLSAVYLIVHTI
jgi:hypothetical protein